MLSLRDTTMPNDKVVDYVLERYQSAWDDDFPFKRRALDAWRSLNSILPKHWKFFGEVYDPVSFVACQDAWKHMMGSIFAHENFFDVEAEDSGSRWLPQAVRVELFREHFKTDLRRMRYQVRKALQALDCVSFGNGIVRHQAIRQWLPDGSMILRADEANVSRFNFTPASGSLWLQDCAYAVERIPNMPLDEVIAMAGGDQEVIAQLRAAAENGIQDRSARSGERTEEEFDLYDRLEEAGYKRGGRLRVRENRGNTANLPKVLELLLYAERGPEGNWNRIIIIANRTVKVRDSANLYDHQGPPWTDCKYSFINGECWNGRGVVDIVRDEQDEVNILKNQRNDFVERLRRPQTWIGDMAGVKPSDYYLFEAWPGRVIPMADLNGARRIEERADIVAILSELMNQGRANSQRKSGQSDVSRGMVGNSSGLAKGLETATGMSLFMQKQAQTVAFDLMLMEQTGFQDGLEKTASISQQTLREPRILDVSKNEVLASHGIRGKVMLEPEDIAGKFRVVAMGSSQTQDDPQQAQAVMEWVKMGMGLPGGDRRMKPWDAFRFVGEKMRIPTPGRFIRTDEEIAAEDAKAGGQPAGIPPQLLNAGKVGLAEGVRNGARRVAEQGVPELAAAMAAGGVR